MNANITIESNVLRTKEKIELIVYSLISFFIPFLIANPQLLVGSIVNFFLAVTAIKFDLRYSTPVIFLPSLGVFFAGLIFGVNTKYLIYFIPFIWIANFIFVYSFKLKINFFVKPLVASLLKAAFLFSVAMVMVYLFDFPKMFLLAMGLLQLITALIGGYLAVVTIKIINKQVQ